MQTNIYFRIYGEIYVVDLAQTMYFKTEDHYTHVYYLSGTHFMIPFGLQDIETEISNKTEHCKYFIRSGRKHILNTKHIFHINTIKQIVMISDNQGTIHTINHPKNALKILIKSFYCQK